MYCILCTVCALLFTILAIFKFAFFASLMYPKSSDIDEIDHGQDHEYDVIIMGAGISGIAAATQLFMHGITNILIIEAQDYVGGRIKTIEFGDDDSDPYTINIGASHLFAADLNAKNISNEQGPNIILNLLDKFNLKYEIDNNPQNKIPFLDRLSDDKYHLLTDHRQNELNIKRLYKLYGNQDLYVSDKMGLNGILLNLAADLIENGKIDILLNEPIKSIQHHQNGVNITTENENQYHAKYGINTFSFGVLQGNTVNFQPSLPPWKYEAIFEHKMLKHATIYIQWPMDFWSKRINANSYKLFDIESLDFLISVYNMNDNEYFSGSNIWKIDLITNKMNNYKSGSIEENIYKFILNKFNSYFDHIPQPLDVFVTQWNTNPFIKGIVPIFYGHGHENYSKSHQNFDIDHWRRIQSRVNRIFFAGDGISRQHYGTITGGYLSGIKAANEIMSCLKTELHPHCPREYVRHENDYFVEILKQFTDDYRVYFSWWIEFVAVRLMIMLWFCLLIIRRIVKYVLKDSF